ncbi:MAG: right-handed parallel beta-helix repeat-containing protein [Pirellulaceae bacterium]
MSRTQRSTRRRKHSRKTGQGRELRRHLQVQSLERRQMLAGDMDDQIGEAIPIALGATASDSISELIDVDMYSISLANGQTIGIDVDSADRELDSGLRVFDAAGNELAYSDDDRGPGAEYDDLEAYVLFTAPAAGTYYIGVSTYDNFFYDPTDGTGDEFGDTVGDYELIIDDAPVENFFLVNTTGDLPDANLGDGIAEDVNGNTSLRAAIEEINTIANTNTINTIEFDIDYSQIDVATGRFVTQPATPLPAIEVPVEINAFNLIADDFPAFQIDGSVVSGTNTDGLLVTGDGVQLFGVAIANFPGDGVEINGAAGFQTDSIESSGNGGYGMRLQNASGADVVFSTFTSNAKAGIVVAGTTPGGHDIRYNSVGVRYDTTLGTDVVDGNGTFGIYVLAGENVLRDNVVSGNVSTGIAISGPVSGGNQLVGNRVGTDLSGEIAMPNGAFGILIKSANNILGGPNSYDANVVSGNARTGVAISGAAATNNSLYGNMIGVNLSGDTPIPNGSFGVQLSGSSNNTIGGTGPYERNVVSGNDRSGIVLSSGSSSNDIVNNSIGVDVTGMIEVGNGGNGLFVLGGSSDNDFYENVIGANAASQVSISNITSTGNALFNNMIGVNADGSAELAGGGSTGVFIKAPETQVIGNVIAGASSTGIHVSSTAAYDNQLIGNLIGTASPELNEVYGMPIGVRFSVGARDNTLGPGNTIGYSTSDAVRNDSGGEGNTITQNVMAGNAFGIDLGGNGVTPNDGNPTAADTTDDDDTGPNRLQNTATSLVVNATPISASQTQIAFDYFVDSNPANAAYPLTVEFFVSDPTVAQGAVYVASDVYTTADYLAGGASYSAIVDNADFTISPDAGTATVTDSLGNTSEFTSPAVPIAFPSVLLASAASSVPINYNPLDVTRDGEVTPSDVLSVIEVLSAQQTDARGEFASLGQASERWDINKDGHLSPADVLTIINHLSESRHSLSLAAIDALMTDDDEAALFDGDLIDHLLF